LKNTTTSKTNLKAGSSLSSLIHIDFLICVLYAIVHFVPDMGTQDPINSQWLYVSLLDVLAAGYIIARFNKFKKFASYGIKNAFIILYAILLVWILGSFFYATNQIEVLVISGRFITTLIAVLNIALLLSNNTKLIEALLFLLAAVLIIESISTLKSFSANFNDMNLDDNILELRGLNGNKNVMAASIMIKIPFCLYFLYTSKNGWLRSLFGIINTLALITLFILNTRSTFVSLGLISLLYFVYHFVQKPVGKKIKDLVVSVLFFLIPLSFAFLISTQILNTAKELPQNAAQQYGDVTSRLSTIQFTDEGSSARLRLWREALDYAWKHPIFGCGFGNWKLESIPYEKEYANEADVPYHCHNDFLEISTELGIPGFLMYLGLFILLSFFTLKVVLKSKNTTLRNIMFFAFLGLVAYGVDALLNFPAERTIIQVIFAFIVALLLITYYQYQQEQGLVININKFAKIGFIIIPLVLLVPTIYVNYSAFLSSKAQRLILVELSKAVPEMPLAEVENAFPEIPNLSYSTIPIKGALARYYIREKQYSKAMSLIKQSRKDNPYLSYDNYLMTSYYASKQNQDSALFFAKKTYFNRPRAFAYYQNLISIASFSRDSAIIDTAFKTFIKYRNEPQAWTSYIKYISDAKRRVDLKTRSLADSAMLLFPRDSALIKFVQLLSGPAETDVFIKKAFESFNKKDYASAADAYQKAIQIDSNNYANYENLGLCYYLMNDFNQAIRYFNKAIQFKTCVTGKSAFFRGIALINIGKKQEGCASFQLAQQKQYPQASEFIDKNCR
jgi:O-antigen ligase